MNRFLLATLLLLFIAPSAWADDIFVANKPYKGQIYGIGADVRFSLDDLAKALSIPVNQTPEGWFLGSRKVEVHEEHGVVWVSLDDLPTDLIRVVRNKEFATIDIYRVEGASTDPAQESWAGGGLIFYGANWDPHTKSMLSTIAEIEKSKIVQVFYVDVEDSSSPAYRQFAYLFEGNKIPFFVVLDHTGRKVHSFYGFQTYNQMLNILRQYVK